MKYYDTIQNITVLWEEKIAKELSKCMLEFYQILLYK